MNLKPSLSLIPGVSWAVGKAPSKFHALLAPASIAPYQPFRGSYPCATAADPANIATKAAPANNFVFIFDPSLPLKKAVDNSGALYPPRSRRQCPNGHSPPHLPAGEPSGGWRRTQTAPAETEGWEPNLATGLFKAADRAVRKRRGWSRGGSEAPSRRHRVATAGSDLPFQLTSRFDCGTPRETRPSAVALARRSDRRRL